MESAARRYSEITAHHERRERLIALHGEPEMVNAVWALRLLISQLDIDEVSSDDVVAFRYRNQAAADAYHESNLTHNGVEALGTVVLNDGSVIGVLDLRPELQLAKKRSGCQEENK